MKPFFSIIIPVYNVAPYLHECLDSVLAQTFTDWEAICVDDGSTDGSGAILDEYAAKDRRFKIIHQENAGVSAARNVALALAHGEYVAFVDADDAVAPYWLQSACNLLVGRPDLGMMSCRRWYGGECESARQTKVEQFDTQEQVLNFFVNHVYGYTPFLFFCRRDILRGWCFDRRLERDEDVAYFSLVFLRANSMVTSDYAGYLYRQREDSADHTHINDIDDAKFIDVVKENYLALTRDEECRACYRKWLSRRVISDVWARCAKGRFGSCNTVKALRSALRVSAVDSRFVPFSRKIFVGLIRQFGVFAWCACALIFSLRNFIRKKR